MKHKINSKDFRVPPGDKVDLKKWPTKIESLFKSKKKYHKRLKKHVEELSETQRMHYVSDRHAVLLIFQAMDAAGKDGAIRHVMSGINPQGCQVFSFKQPSAEQRERFIDRIDEPDKNWKFSAGDVSERKRWDDYMEAYEGCLTATSTTDSPWHVVPADSKKNARLIISHIILVTMKDLGLSYPEVSEARLKELQEIRECL